MSNPSNITTSEPDEPDDGAAVRPDDGAFDASDPRKISERNKRIASRTLFCREGLRKVMADRESRAYMHKLLADCGVWQQSFTPGDPHHTSFREGKRAIGLGVLADIMREHSAQYLLMVNENGE